MSDPVRERGETVGIRYQAASGSVGAAPELTVSPLGERSGLRVAGEVGLTTHEVWRRALDQAVREDGDVYYLELSAVTFVDVAGAGALATAAQRLGDGRRMVLHQPPPGLRRVLDMFWPDLSSIEVSIS
ncbi:STAS domain-containing protein [Streptomyces sp. ALI-76-A]|jgi:anti-anti-sigma factor|uniref:STAS domain-containing protein n=1 Tax=Streptomyces sp. ALI-76-A TaxID=3025736 RepID=UPI00256F61EE|nr:STAS domain-containing protein [Streptomyces sp. ALI-76-A]MDL5201429.1 STAS domain-containing protein [Streptomyces sp. ALI-76-A]